MIIGRFALSEHSYKVNSELNHKDLFLYFQDNSCLITYKVPKNTINGFGIRQKDHRLKYLAYEGNFRENENLRITKRGYVIAHSWLFTHTENNYAKIIFESLNGSIENMWKKTDFKIALDEIKLYEVNDEKHIQTDKQISSKVIDEIPTGDISEVRKEELKPAEVKHEIPEVKEIEKEEIIAGEKKPEIKAAIKEIVKEGTAAEEEKSLSVEPAPQKEPVTPEITPVEPGQVNPFQQADNLKTVYQPVKEITYAPIKEMVLNPDGKSEEEYK